MQSFRISLLAFFLFVGLYAQADSRDWIKSSQSAITSQNIDHAIFCYTQAIDNNSKNVTAYLLRAKAYQLNGDFIKAAEDKRTAFTIDAHSSKILLNSDQLSREKDTKPIEKNHKTK